jgi:hypothetical protein
MQLVKYVICYKVKLIPYNFIEDILIINMLRYATSRLGRTFKPFNKLSPFPSFGQRAMSADLSPQEEERDQLDYDVLIVGGGPAGKRFTV